jgi:hypothetical protein
LQRNTASYKNYASASKEQRPLPQSGLKSRGETKSSSEIAEFTSFDCAHGLPRSQHRIVKPTLATNVAYGPKCEVPRCRLYRRYRENSGSDVEIAKPTRLTRSRNEQHG